MCSRRNSFDRRCLSIEICFELFAHASWFTTFTIYAHFLFCSTVLGLEVLHIPFPLLRHYCQVLDTGYEFLKGYGIPTGSDVNVYRRHIDENLPAVDVPEVVGLNQNADLTYRLQQVNENSKFLPEKSPTEI